MTEETKKAKKIIKDVIYLTLATCDKNRNPWCTPVYTACNDNYEFFWASGFETRHSVNIRENPKIGAALYDSSLPEGEGEALYMDGIAAELLPETWQDGLNLLRGRSNFPDKYFPYDDYQRLGPVRIYKFTPRSFYVLHPKGDERYDTYADCRMEIKLK